MEQPLICVDEMDLRALFENTRPAKEYKATIAIQEVKRCFKKTLMWFAVELKHPPKAVYFKLVTSDDVPMSLLEALQRIGQAAGEDAQCIFAYDRQPDIPKEQCYLKMMVA